MGQTLGGIVGVFQAEQQAKALQYNEKVTKWAAAQEKIRAARIAEEGWRRDQAAISEGRAQFGAAGVDLASGSPLLWEIESITQAAMSKVSILDQGEINSANLRNQAKVYKWQAKQTRTWSYINLGLAVVADVTSAIWPQAAPMIQQDASRNLAQSREGMNTISQRGVPVGPQEPTRANPSGVSIREVK